MLNDAWDIMLDGSGDIATTSGGYGIAQNVANAARLFTRDAYYDPERGVPHFLIDLGVQPNLSIVRNRLRKAALSVDGVADASVTITAIVDRVMQGIISVTTTDGEILDVAF